MSPGAERLGAVVERVRRHLGRRSLVAAASWAAAGVLLLAAGAWLLAGPEGWRAGSAAPLVLVVLMAVWAGATLVGTAAGMRRWFADARVAAVVERAGRLRTGEVRGALELGNALPRGVSAALAGHAAETTARALRGLDARTLSGDLGGRVTRWSRRGLGLLTVAVLLVVGLAVASPGRATRAWAGLAAPFAALREEALPPLAVHPGTIEFRRGEDVEVRIEAAGRTWVELAWQTAGDVHRVARLDVTNGVARHVLPAVAAETEYRVRPERGPIAGPFRLVPVDPLFVGDLVIGVEYPPHTGLPEEEHRGAAPPLRLPAGTVLTFEGRANRTLSGAELRDTTGASVVGFDLAADTFRARWRPGEGGTYAWRFVDAEGAEAELRPDPLEITIVPDAPPAVAIPVPGRDTVLPLNLRQPLVVEAQDDYGLEALELVAWRVSALGEAGEPNVRQLALEGARGAMARPVLDVSSWGLMPGDTVRYFARVRDNAPGGQTARTPEYTLVMPSAAALRREAERTLAGAAERLETLSAETRQQAEENRAQAMEGRARRDASRDPRAGGEPGAFDEREQMRRALEEQERLGAELDSLGTRLRELERRLEEAGQADPALRAQLRELQELIEQLSGEPMERRMQELAEALSQEDRARAMRSLEEMAREQELMRERLDASLERFRRAAVEQDFRATTSEAEELARQERALADALREDVDPGARSGQQEELATRAEALDERLEELRERLGQLGEEAAAERVAQATERSREAAQEMAEAGRRAEAGEREPAAENAAEAARAMEQAAAQLREAQQQMAQEQSDQAREALERTADDALALARRQTELGREMREGGRERITALRPEEASLLEGLENLASRFQEATRGQVPGSRELSGQMGRAMQAIERTLQAMDGPRSFAPSPLAESDRAVEELNRLALMTLESAEAMAQRGEGGNPAGEEEMRDALQQLAQEQGDLANQSGQILPMQLGRQAMAEQAEQLAQGQQAVSDRLGELSDQPGSEGALGDLQEFAGEAAELARQLAEGRLTPETAQRQERLFHRLLDAGRSLEQDEVSEERESEQAGAFERGEVMPLDPSQLGLMPYRLPGGEQLRALSPGVRQLVLDYFERLNRERVPQGGGDR